MKKLIFAATIFALVMFGSRSLYAQTTDYDSAYQTFVASYDEYLKQHSEYDVARSGYLQNKTITAQAKAQQETYEMLSARDEVLINYLNVLKLRLGLAVGVDEAVKQSEYTKLDLDLDWYTTHKATLSSAASLEDQTADSNEAKQRYDSITQKTIYEVLAQIALGKDSALRLGQKNLISDTKTILSTITTNGDLDTSFLERALLEVENRNTRSEGKNQDAQKILVTLEKSRNPSAGYSDLQFRLNESIQYLKEANTYLLQIIGQIKGGQ